jgi:hypothetical protein
VTENTSDILARGAIVFSILSFCSCNQSGDDMRTEHNLSLQEELEVYSAVIAHEHAIASRLFRTPRESIVMLDSTIIRMITSGRYGEPPRVSPVAEERFILQLGDSLDELRKSFSERNHSRHPLRVDSLRFDFHIRYLSDSAYHHIFSKKVPDSYDDFYGRYPTTSGSCWI